MAKEMMIVSITVADVMKLPSMSGAMVLGGAK